MEKEDVSDLGGYWIDTIQKQHLTTSWLNDNCEKDYSGYGWECSYDFKIDEGCSKWEFMKYKCGSYFIEVLP